MPLAFFTIRVLSKLDRSRRAAEDEAPYLDQRVRSETGIDSVGAGEH